VPERDVTGLAGAIDRLLTDRALAARLGDTARRWAIAEGSWSRAAERFEGVYDRAASLAAIKSAY
jgi:glycosyltransferase involved in cell wall biosynthesis